MFISWAVTSYQSNGARCDFSQGISVCLIEIPYPDPSGLPGLSYTNGHRRHPRLPLPRNSHASRSSLPPVLHSFDLLSPSLAVYACVCARARACALRSIITSRSFCSAQLYLVRFRLRYLLSRVLRQSSLLPLRVYPSSSLQITALINIAFCPSYPFIARLV